MYDDHLLSELSENTKAFWVSPISIVDNPSELDFMRAIHLNKPVIFKGMISHWKALNWTLDYLSEIIADPVKINFTKSGNADSIQWVEEKEGKYFIYPAEIEVTFDLFKNMLMDKFPLDCVPYLSSQDDNIRKYFHKLLHDIDTSIPHADSVFGKDKLEAVNLWIGDERSVTSLHKDFYENMFAVVTGTKVFHMYPPSDSIFMYEQEFPALKYSEICKERDLHKNHVLKSDIELIELDTFGGVASRVPWIELDPLDPQVNDKFPLFKKASPMVCNVHAGDVLYIPAMWYHRVTQTETTIAVNYWYDMNFDYRWNSLHSPYLNFHMYILCILHYRYVLFEAIKRKYNSKS
jgi:jumonji domain-containing protein 7